MYKGYSKRHLAECLFLAFHWVKIRVKIHNITPVTGKERGDLEIKDYVVMQKPQPQGNRLPPPRTLIMDYTMTHIRFGRSHLHPMDQLTNTRRSDGDWPRCVIKRSGQNQNQAIQEFVLESPGPYCIYTFSRGHYWTDVWWIYPFVIFAHPPWSIGFGYWFARGIGQFRFLHVSCFANLKGAVGLIMTKASAIRISIPLDLSSRPFIPLPCFIRSRRPTPL